MRDLAQKVYFFLCKIPTHSKSEKVKWAGGSQRVSYEIENRHQQETPTSLTLTRAENCGMLQTICVICRQVYLSCLIVPWKTNKYFQRTYISLWQDAQLMSHMVRIGRWVLSRQHTAGNSSCMHTQQIVHTTPSPLGAF